LSRAKNSVDEKSFASATTPLPRVIPLDFVSKFQVLGRKALQQTPIEILWPPTVIEVRGKTEIL